MPEPRSADTESDRVEALEEMLDEVDEDALDGTLEMVEEIHRSSTASGERIRLSDSSTR